MLNRKTIVTALVIAQAGGVVMEMFAARHSLSIRSLFRALAVLHWCNIADVEKICRVPPSS
jgi:hypothetical protein